MSTPIGELEYELENLLRDSIKRQLVSDVPLGILLSGGIDSSLVTAIASDVCSEKVKTFTVSFPGDNQYNESSYAKIVSDHFNTDHHELEANSLDFDLIQILARQFDEPMCDSSMLPTYLLSNLIKEHCTVALGGDGGDELFGGYTTYQWIYKQNILNKKLNNITGRALSYFITRFVTQGIRGREYLLAFGNDLPLSLAHNNILFDFISRKKLLVDFDIHKKSELIKLDLIDKGRGIPSIQQALDFKTYLVDDILVKVDRASMLNSLEVRAPLLDYRIIEFAFSMIPNQLKATTKERKILLKNIARKYLPANLPLNRKQGFSLPLNRWFDGKKLNEIERIIIESTSDLFNEYEVKKLINNQKKRYINNTERIYSLLLFSFWRQHYQIAI